MTKTPARAAILAGALVLSAAAHASGQVTGVRVARMSSGVEVLVTGEGLARPETSLSPDGRSYRLDFDAPLKGRPMIAETGFASVPKVGIAWISKKPAKIRVALSVAAGAKPVVTPSNGSWKVSVPNAASKPTAPAKPKPLALRAVPIRPISPKTDPAPMPTHTVPTLLATAAPIAPATLRPIAQPSPEKPVPPKPLPPKPLAPKPVVSKPAAPKPLAPKSAPRVSLDFSNTDVRQVLKMLALQTNSNIITANGVTGDKISLSLHNVTTEQALNLVCTAANLRYTYREGSYVVTTKAGYQEAQRNTGGQYDEPMMTRVVPIYSGEGQQVKAAVLKATSGDNMRGRFELVLPSEEITYTEKRDVTPEGRMAKDGDEAQLKISSNAKSGKDAYVMVVGTPSRLDEIAALTHQVDAQICLALGRTMPESPALFTKVYNVRGSRASDLVAAIAGPNASRIGGVSILATPSGSISRQTVLLQGREDEVMAVYASLEQLDANDSAIPEFLSIDLRFSDPRSMREMLLSSVPGLAVTIPPSPVGNPRVYQRDESRRQSEERGTELPAPQGGGTQMANPGAMQQTTSGGQGQQQQITIGGDDLSLNGLTQPYRDLEPIAVPMRLVLRGSADQIARGQALIRALDIAPKHVAIELRVMELNREDAIRAGLDLNLTNGGAVSFIRLNNAQSVTPTNSISADLGSRRVPLTVTATLDKLATRNNLISRPNTIALDGRETELFIGDVIRYIESIISSQNGVTVTTNEVRVGVRVAVLPRVGGDGSITMDLRPAVSFLRGFDDVAQIGGKLPQTSERVSQSSFNMRSGETIAISGLITDQDRRQVQGLPFLMDLPIVGQLFRRTTNERIRSELVIFVTARTIDGPLNGDGPLLPAEPEFTNRRGYPGPDAPDLKSKRDGKKGSGDPNLGGKNPGDSKPAEKKTGA